MIEQVDVVIVGLGVAGEELAARLLRGGLSVVGVEQRLIGGECKNWACIPTKMMVRSANLLAEAARVNVMAGRASVTADWSPTAHRIREEAAEHWDDSASVNHFEAEGGRFVRGRARLAGPGRVIVEGPAGQREFAAARGVVLATGTEPAIPDVDGLAGTPYWTNRDVAQLTEVPRSVIVLGGGPVGLELAQILRRFGAAVSLVEQADRLLAAEEAELSAVAARALAADLVDVRAGATVRRVSHDGEEFRLTMGDDSSLTAQRLLIATGRKNNVDGLDLDTVGLPPDSSTVDTDGYLRAGPRLWAIGDITGRGQFTHVATYQARIAAADILGHDVTPADYRAVPRIVFTDPELGAVGLTEAQARRQGIRVRTGSARIPESARGWMHRAGNDGLVKLIADADRDVLVGAVSAGPAGGDVLGLLTLAVRAQVPLSLLRDMIYGYPTFHRAVEDALRDLDIKAAGTP